MRIPPNADAMRKPDSAVPVTSHFSRALLVVRPVQSLHSTQSPSLREADSAVPQFVPSVGRSNVFYSLFDNRSINAYAKTPHVRIPLPCRDYAPRKADSAVPAYWDQNMKISPPPKQFPTTSQIFPKSPQSSRHCACNDTTIMVIP